MRSCDNSKLQNKNFAPFPHLNSFLDENELDVNKGALELMKRHFFILGKKIRQHLEDFQKHGRFVNNSFGTSAWRSAFIKYLVQEQFIGLVNNENARSLFTEKSLSDFWIKMAQTYPEISKMVLKVVISLPRTYEYESAF